MPGTISAAPFEARWWSRVLRRGSPLVAGGELRDNGFVGATAESTGQLKGSPIMPLERPGVGTFAGLALERKRALVTGANRGIGRQIAIELAGRGLQVIVAARQAAAAEETVKAIRDQGNVAEPLVLDVSDS